jgi:hypothetical protein
MAELAALGLASNIFQIVHFGSSLFSKTRKIAQTAHGVGEEEIELETIVKDLKYLSLKLKPDLPSAGHAGLSSSDNMLNGLIGPCCEIADELLKIFDDLKAIYSRSILWKNFRQALRHVRKEREIRSLEARLERLQAQISTHLIAALRYNLFQFQDRSPY